MSIWRSDLKFDDGLQSLGLYFKGFPLNADCTSCLHSRCRHPQLPHSLEQVGRPMLHFVCLCGDLEPCRRDPVLHLRVHGGPHPVMEHFRRVTACSLEGHDVAAQNRFQPPVGAESSPQPAAVAEHKREQPDPAADPGLVGEPDRELGEVELGLPAGRGFERTSKRFGRSLRSLRRKSVNAVWPPVWPSLRISRGNRRAERPGQAVMLPQGYAS